MLQAGLLRQVNTPSMGWWPCKAPPERWHYLPHSKSDRATIIHKSTVYQRRQSKSDAEHLFRPLRFYPFPHTCQDVSGSQWPQFYRETIVGLLKSEIPQYSVILCLSATLSTNPMANIYVTSALPP